MKITTALLIGFVCGIAAYGQTSPVPATVNIPKPVTVLPDNARYKLVKLEYFSSVINNGIIMLDRYTGKTSSYDPGKRKWYLLNVRGGLPASSSDTPKYQFFSEGEYYTFLLNTETGQSWVLFAQTWEPIAD